MTNSTELGAPAPGPQADWTAALSPELKSLVEIKGYKEPADVVQAYAHAQRLIGAEKIPLPKDGVWDETAREKLGIPKAPADYQLARPDLPQGLAYDEAFESAALPVAHKLGLTPHQVQGLLEFYAGHQAQSFQSAGRARLDEQTLALDALKDDWGAAYDANVAQAARAARHFGGDALIEFLNDSGAGNNPQLVRAFAKIGAMMSEDSLKGGAANSFSLAPGEALREARKLMAKQGYTRRDHPEHAGLVEKVQRLFEQAYVEET